MPALMGRSSVMTYKKQSVECFGASVRGSNQ